MLPEPIVANTVQHCSHFLDVVQRLPAKRNGLDTLDGRSTTSSSFDKQALEGAGDVSTVLGGHTGS